MASADGRDAAPPAGLPAGFIETVYLAANPDVGAAVAQGAWPTGAAHWLERGWREERPSLPHEPGLAPGIGTLDLQPGPETEAFDAEGYLHLHPDLVRAMGRDLVAARAHWLSFGRFEGRLSPGARPHIRRRPALETLLSRPFGLDVHAAFAAPGARGAGAAHLVGALLAAGLPVTARGFVPGGRAARIPRIERQRPSGHRASLLLAEPEEVVALAALYPPGAFGSSYVIAAWSMPVDRFGAGLHAVFGALDELWVADAETAAAYRAIAPIPVRALPPDGDGAAVAMLARLRELGLDVQPPPFVAGLGRSRRLAAPSLAAHLPDAVWRRIVAIRDRPSVAILLSLTTGDPAGAAVALTRCVAAVIAQSFPFWTLTVLDDGAADADARAVLETLRGCDPRLRIESTRAADPRQAINRSAAAATATHLLPLRVAQWLTPHALLEFATTLDRTADGEPALALLYADEELLEHPDLPGRIVRWPDTAPEQLRTGPCTGDLLLMSQPSWHQLGGLRADYGDAAGYDFVLRLLEAGLPMRHVPTLAVRTLQRAMTVDAAAPDQVLRALHAHADRLGARIEPAAMPGRVRFRPPVGPMPPVSIVIGAEADDADPLPLVRRLRQWHGAAAAEIVLLVRPGRKRPGSAALRALAARTEPLPSADATVGARRMLALERSRHPLVLFLDGAAQPDEALLPALLDALHDPMAAAAGTRLLPSPERHDRPGSVRNVSALSGDCLLLRRDIARAVGGFDETLILEAACDADFGLRLRAAGYRLVFTPYGSSGPAPAATPIDQESVQAALAAIWHAPTRERLDENRVSARIGDALADADRSPPDPGPVPSVVPLRPAAQMAAVPAVADDRDLAGILAVLGPTGPAVQRKPTGPMKTRRGSS